jgi:hypothetical protein
MKHVLQSLEDGTTRVAEVPAASAGSGQLLIHTTASLVSSGTERMLIEFGKANWVDKARQQPDKVRMVLDKVRTDGLAVMVEAVQSKLDQPLAVRVLQCWSCRRVGCRREGLRGARSPEA